MQFDPGMEELGGDHGLGDPTGILPGVLGEHGADHELLRPHLVLVQPDELVCEQGPHRRDPRPRLPERRRLEEDTQHPGLHLRGDRRGVAPPQLDAPHLARPVLEHPEVAVGHADPRVGAGRDERDPAIHAFDGDR